MVKFIQQVLLTWTVIFSLAMAIALILTSNSERKEKKKKILSIAFVVSLISAGLLLFNGIKEKIEKNENDANDSLISRRSDTIKLQGDSSLKNTVMLKNQDSIIKLQQDSIRLQSDSIKNNTKELLGVYKKLNIKNDSLIKKQEEITMAQNAANRLQNELFNQVTGGNAIPELIADTTIFPGNNYRLDYDGRRERLVIHLQNSEKYPLNRVKVEFQRIQRRPVSDPVITFYDLMGSRKIILEDYILDDQTFFEENFESILSYIISWNVFSYSLQISIRKIDLSGAHLKNIYRINFRYFFNGKPYYSIKELVDALTSYMKLRS